MFGKYASVYLSVAKDYFHLFGRDIKTFKELMFVSMHLTNVAGFTFDTFDLTDNKILVHDHIYFYGRAGN